MSSKSQHHRRTSKGSRSLFSGDLWRSISRARSRSTLNGVDGDIDSRIASTLQCDPSRQAPLSEDIRGENNHYSSVQTLVSTSLRTLYRRNSNSPSPALAKDYSQRRKSRPLSWLFLTRHKPSPSDSGGHPTVFAQPDSMSSMSRSQISTPILTRTTNACVADSENVEYTDILLPDYSSREALSPGSRQGASHTQHIQHSIVHPSTWSATVRSMKQKLTHRRRASTSVLLETPWSRRVAEMKERDDAQNAHSTSTFHTYRDIFHRNRHEVVSPRKRLEDDASTQGHLTSLAFITRNKSTPDFQLPPRLPGLYSNSNTDLLAPSLTKSFAIAIDKLDFNSSPTLLSDGTPISKLKKAKSYLSLHRLVREYSDRTLDRDEIAVSSSPIVLVSKAKAMQSSVDGSSTERERDDMYKPKIRASKPIQLRFSGQKKRYVPSKPDTNSPSGVNPLRMHPEVGNGANSLDQFSPTTPSFPDDTDGRHSGTIDRAVIYSPSTGNLSVYSRTPSSAVQAAIPRQRTPQGTPTRKPLHKASGSMLRKGVSTFFGKSASMIKVGNLTPTKRSLPEKGSAGAGRHRTISDTKLLNSRVVSDLRARSMSTPEMHTSETTRAPWGHQPSTPSPLRKSMMVDAAAKGRQRAATSTTPIRPTAGIMLDKARSNSVLSDPEKRYGRYIDQADALKIAVC